MYEEFKYWQNLIHDSQWTYPHCKFAKFLRETPLGQFDLIAGSKQITVVSNMSGYKYMNVRCVPLLGFLMKLELHKR